MGERHRVVGGTADTFDFPQGTLVILERYHLDLLGPDPKTANQSFSGPVVATNFGISPNLLKEIEENINDLLPEPFKAVIR